ncbi:hypothetical protein J558_0352 [Acinetobacter baumannii 1106579]|nr:hypothetical protein J558_0352 [Acinetobacter baumannii 1106579]
MDSSISILKCSWRHTPFRKLTSQILFCIICSWRHTPFRKSFCL